MSTDPICGYTWCGRPKSEHGGPGHNGKCPGMRGLDAPRFRAARVTRITAWSQARKFASWINVGSHHAGY